MPVQQPPVNALSTEHLQADLKGRSVRGGLATITSQGTQFLLQSVSTVVLARILTPADFGLVAMVTAITGLGQAFADLGLSQATIQREDVNHHQVSTLFWINVATGLTLMLIAVALAPALAWFYREPRLKEIALVLSCTFLIGGLRVQHEALLKRQMRFTAVAIRDVTSSAVGVSLAIIMAWRGAGYWAIVAFPIASQFARMALSWLAVRWIPTLPQRDARVRSMVVFGGNVSASFLLTYISRNADNALIGWWWGAGPLGLYSRAYNLLMLPVQQLNAPVGQVVISTFSRIQGDRERFARYYLRVAKLMTWITAPTFGFLFVAAEPVIVLVLGNQWWQAAPVFQILAISGLGQLLFNSTIWLFVSRGESGRLFKLLLVTTPIIIGSFVIGLPFGINGVALSGSLVFIALLPWMLKYAFRGTNLTLQRLAQAILYPVSLCLVGIIVGELVLQLIAPERMLSQLLLVAVTFVAVYSLAALIPAVREEMASLVRLLNNLRPSTQIARSAA
jgi:PST family polysaccharide transporter